MPSARGGGSVRLDWLVGSPQGYADKIQVRLRDFVVNQQNQIRKRWLKQCPSAIAGMVRFLL
jgi:hypothetical protein